MKFECIKGITTDGYGYDKDEMLLVMQGDIVTFDGSDEGEICVTGIDGWCEGMELRFTPKEIADHFKVIHS